MKTTKEIRDWLLENAVDEEGDLMLDDLDFSDFAGNVYICDMKVQGDLNQSGQEVQGDLDQVSHKVQGDLYHGDSRYGGKLIAYPYRELLKEITSEELEKLGYKLKEETKWR